MHETRNRPFQPENSGVGNLLSIIIKCNVGRGLTSHFFCVEISVAIFSGIIQYDCFNLLSCRASPLTSKIGWH
jgi:hypothetical protein